MASAAPHSLLARIRARLAGRPDSEHNQAIVRLAIVASGAPASSRLPSFVWTG